MDSPPPRLMDYHLHSAVTVDARMSESEACERAAALGIQEIAFTNHIMLNQPAYLMSPQECAAHWERIRACQSTYPALTIRLGIEMDYYPGRETAIASAIQEYEGLLGRPFDIVLGSIHELDGIFFSNQRHAPALYEGRDLVSLYCEYFTVATQAVRSRVFDVMAHPDLIKKYTNELTPPLAFEHYRAAAEAYIDALLDTGTGMELNTKGLKLQVAEAYPSREMLSLYLSKATERGVGTVLTLGSDAHHADDVGARLQEGAALLRGLGITELAAFKGRRRLAWVL